MAQPFRDSGLACPGCRENLRIYGAANRLVCDHCTSMMLATDDFVASLTDRIGDKPTIVDGARSDKVCPRCTAPFATARIRLDNHDLATVVYHCETDGVWFAGGDLEKVLTQIGKTSQGMFAGSASKQGAFGSSSPPNALGLGTGLEGGNIALHAVNTAFAGRDPFVLWWWRKPKPRHHEPFTSAFTAGALACPVCSDKLELHGNLWGCHGGHGVFVENEALEAMATDISGAPWSMPVPKGKDGSRACPACTKPLVVEKLEGVDVDRCATHGTWFDPKELEAALAHAAEPKHGLRHWLRHLFE